eukprot:7248653-Lingulodinium_polyedra.AAC.1
MIRADTACEAQRRRVANEAYAADLFEEFLAIASACGVAQGVGPNCFREEAALGHRSRRH